jgi:phosphoglycerol transferase MdoB-like AlkP superfamily enzyme
VVPDLADLELVPSLLRTMSGLQAAGTLALAALPLACWGAALAPPRRWWRSSGPFLALPALLAVAGAWLVPGWLYRQASGATHDVEWSDQVMAEHWGRLYALGMREVRRRSFQEQLAGATPLDRSPLLLSPALLRRIDHRNVHLVLLESFLDVRQLEGVAFSEPPLAPEFVAWADAGTGVSLSPAFGGETARAEFEVLCGVPSLRLYGLEFLAFSGRPTYCLPAILRQAGYAATLTFPGGPLYFNERLAYPGLGFEQVIYGDRFSAPGQEAIALPSASYLPDPDLYRQNLDHVRRLLASGRPFLNYVVTMWGHWPFELDPSAFPRHARLEPADEPFQKVTDLMWHRSAALRSYVRELQRLDPRGIVVLLADHLPPMPNGFSDYERLGFAGQARLSPAEAEYRDKQVFLLVLVDGQVVRLPRLRHFDVERWLLDQLTGGAYCQEKGCDDFGQLPIAADRYLDRYRTILSLASRRD